MLGIEDAAHFERAKVTGGRLLTWPQVVNKRLGLRKGDYLYVFVDGRRITMVTRRDLSAELERRDKALRTRRQRGRKMS